MKFLLTLLVTFISFNIFAQNQVMNDSGSKHPAENTFHLKGEITKLRNSKGTILLQILDADKKKIKSLKLVIENNVCFFDLGDLPKRAYAISYFHDENSDEEMNTNFMGIPKEGYGFSNNATAMFSAPPFEERLFTLNEDKFLDLNIKYML